MLPQDQQSASAIFPHAGFPPWAGLQTGSLPTGSRFICRQDKNAWDRYRVCTRHQHRYITVSYCRTSANDRYLPSTSHDAGISSQGKSMKMKRAGPAFAAAVLGLSSVGAPAAIKTGT
jgi:hypothetical protein